MRNSQDFIVIGGGPTGSTAATFLARQGHRVTVFEKEKFPRDHVGESLLPFNYTLFDELGILEDMERTCVRKPGVRFCNIDGSNYTTYCYRHIIKDPSHLSFHVLRAAFDKMLLDNSRKHGATVYEQTRVQSVNLDDPEQVKLRVVDADNHATTHRAKFIIDASGRDTFLATHLKNKIPYQDLDRVAFSTHWSGVKYNVPLQEGTLQIIHLGGDKLGWIWVIPIDEDRVSIGVVLNNDYVRQAQRRLQQNATVTDWQDAFYRQELFSSPVLADLLSNAQTIMPLLINGDYSYSATEKYGSNFAMVGDASAFLDPIFASGVFVGMNSAKVLAQALHKKYAQNDAEAIEKAYTEIDGAYSLIEKFIRLFYNPDAIQLSELDAAIDQVEYGKSSAAFNVTHYLLAGDFFQNHRRYVEFIDLLQDPEVMAKYQNLTHKRNLADSRTESCLPA